MIAMSKPRSLSPFPDGAVLHQGGRLWSGRGPRVGLCSAGGHEPRREVAAILQRVLVRALPLAAITGQAHGLCYFASV